MAAAGRVNVVALRVLSHVRAALVADSHGPWVEAEGVRLVREVLPGGKPGVSEGRLVWGFAATGTAGAWRAAGLRELCPLRSEKPPRRAVASGGHSAVIYWCDLSFKETLTVEAL